jgi:DNA-binding response OmpR family regulator
MLNETVHTELARLRERVAYLEEEKRTRETDANREIAEIMYRTRLTKGRARLLRALCTEGAIDRDRIAALCCHDDSMEYRNTDSQIKRLRKNLTQKGIHIATLYGVGYRIDGDNLARARAYMKGELQ